MPQPESLSYHAIPVKTWPLGHVLNTLADSCSWWSLIHSEDDIVLCPDDASLGVRLEGNEFLTIRLRDGQAECTIASEYLERVHPGYRMVLRSSGSSEPPQRISSLDDLAAGIRLVRKRVIRYADRRNAILDRLWLRHSCILAVTHSVAKIPADLVAMKPDGTCVLFCLRLYQDQSILRQGNGGLVQQIHELEGKMDASLLENVQGLLEKYRMLEHRQKRRFQTMPDPVRLWPRVRVLIVDFDQAQRQLGVPPMRKNLADLLGRADDPNEIITIGDPGNISHRALFSGI